MVAAVHRSSETRREAHRRGADMVEQLELAGTGRNWSALPGAGRRRPRNCRMFELPPEGKALGRYGGRGAGGSGGDPDPSAPPGRRRATGSRRCPRRGRQRIQGDAGRGSPRRADIPPPSWPRSQPAARIVRLSRPARAETTCACGERRRCAALGSRSDGIDSAVCVRVVPVTHKSHVVGIASGASSKPATPESEWRYAASPSSPSLSSVPWPASP